MCVLLSIVASAPLCYIPAKDSYTQMLGLKTLTPKQNRVISISMVIVSYTLAIAIPNISDAITLSGATVNPFIGYIFPILYYIKLDKKPIRSKEKILALVIMVIIIIASFLGLYQYFF